MCDSRVRQDLRNLLEQSGLVYEKSNIIDEPAGTWEELLSQLATTKVVVASRFHNLLLALMLGKPALAISFHEKDDSLMTAMGLEEFRQDIAKLDVSKLIEQFLRLEQDADRLREEIRRKTKRYRRELDKQYSRIFEQSERYKPGWTNNELSGSSCSRDMVKNSVRRYSLRCAAIRSALVRLAERVQQCCRVRELPLPVICSDDSRLR